jgi:hypothetical protein
LAWIGHSILSIGKGFAVASDLNRYSCSYFNFQITDIAAATFISRLMFQRNHWRRCIQQNELGNLERCAEIIMQAQYAVERKIGVELE